ncbi:MAG: RNA polymerase sigma factor [Chitinophagales bacterium]|jgi:RNA polymerase sigma factor (sigma-70 family)|nr:RNA polymerase sigma factor [Chitinophagales bacterium]
MSHLAIQNDIIRLSGTMRPFAYSLTKDMDDAKDLVQETIFKALKYKDKFAEGTNIKAWLYTIMRNIFINDYRRKVKQNTVTDNTETKFILNSTTKTEHNLGVNNLVMKDIDLAMRDLKSEVKVPFMMHFEGFKYQEIAEELDLPLGTVKSRIFIARKELQESLKAYAV